MIAPAPERYDPKRVVADYVDGVLTGRIVAGRLVKLAVKRYVQDLETGGERGWVFSERHAIETCQFCAKFLRFTKGEFADRPFIPSPSQTFILWNIYGWRHKRSVDHAGKVYEPGYRRFKTAYVSCARGWGKSEFASAICLRHAIADDPVEPGARVYCVATKAAQAREAVWLQARNMVSAQNSPLNGRIKCFQHHLSVPIGQPQALSFIAYIGSNSNTADSKDATLMVVDELHAWGERHAELFAKISTSGKARRQALLFVITTAGSNKSALWIAKDKLWVGQLERAVNHNLHDGDHTFVFVARMDESRTCDCGGENADCKACGGSGKTPEDDLYDERNWPKAMPNLPVTPNIQEVRTVASEARHDRLQYQTLRRFYANLQASSSEQPLTAAMWKRCAGKLSDWSRANVVAAGGDLGWRDDLASIALCARFDRDESDGKPASDREGKPLRYRYELRTVSFMPTSGARDTSSEPWAGWIAKGLIRTCEGDMVQIDDVEAAAAELMKRYKAKAFRYDKTNALQMAQHLEKQGFDVIEQGQGCPGYNEPLREFLRLVKAGLICYDAATEPVLTWAISNLTTVSNWKGDIRPDKKSAPEKIDPAVAAIMAFAEAMYAVGGRLTYKAGSLSL